VESLTNIYVLDKTGKFYLEHMQKFVNKHIYNIQ